ncbi:hypothetical protein LTR86_001852 [Recurvomyces mirabilis]|nr:hypothetical protein LTR86_001852 [Recurvomyces mirabilis]
MAQEDNESRDAHPVDVGCLPAAEPTIEGTKPDVLPNKETKGASDTEKQIDTFDRHKGVLAEEDYSVFTTNQKRAIMVIGSLTAWLSPMTGSIYYPALNSIAASLHVTSSKVNLTVTTYLIVQGLAPMRSRLAFKLAKPPRHHSYGWHRSLRRDPYIQYTIVDSYVIAGFSDKAGRRPAYFICFVIYIIANLALALQNSYVALLVLRMLQSAGSSGTVALAQGLVGDLATSSERGKYVAYASVGTLLGPTVSPIIGGVISQYCGWHWIFWFLLILSCAFFVILALFLPETCRKLVGDGSVPPPWTCVNITDTLRHKKRAQDGHVVDEEKKAELRKNFKLTFPNPLGTLLVLADLESALILIATGLAVSCFYAISTGASVAFRDLYGFDDLYVSLMFLPIGVGDRRHAKRLDFPVVKNRQTDLSTFPIEAARLQIALPMFLLGVGSIIGYGWMMDHKISLAGPIVMLFILGYSLIAASQTLNVLIIDIYPGQPATATAANNVTRCLLGAAATAAIGPMSKAMGNGWAYTTLALIFLATCAGPLATMKYGMAWRQAKKQRDDMARKQKESRKADKAANTKG